MRRARIALALASLALVVCASGNVRAAQNITRLNGIGVLDYTHKPTFKVGDYVRYAVARSDKDGNTFDRYNMTVMIASQEVWWGEPCFYIETWVDDGKTLQTTAATLMSYSIFGDTLAEEHVQMYMRKTVMGYDSETDKLDEMLVTPKPNSLTARPAAAQPHSVRRDTLGADTVQTPLGTLHSLKVITHQAWGKTGGLGDSTLYKELREDRMQWLCDQVPMTRYAREETRTSETRRVWLIGRSQDAPPAQEISASTVSARLVAYGHGLRSMALPANRIHSFDEPPAGKRPAPAARPKGAPGSARKR